MKSELFKKILTEWQESSLPEGVRRMYVYPPDFVHILALIGPRRAGKTYFMYQIMQDLLTTISKTEILFLNFEDYRLIGMIPGDIEQALLAHRELYGRAPQYLFFDEIQNLPHYGRVLRTLRDQGYKIVITGSSSRLLLQEVSTELRGRYRHILILPFSLSEQIAAHQISMEHIAFSVRKAEVMHLIASQMRWGGFGELHTMSDGDKIQTLRNYYMTIFYRDILERHGIRDQALFEYLMRYVTESYATIFSVGKFHAHMLSEHREGSKKTLTNYLTYLQEAFYLIIVPRFSTSPRKSLLSPRKIYLIDNGLCLLAHAQSENHGKKLENLVAIHLFSQEKRFFYFQKKHECDFVVQENTQITQAIQVCYQLTPENTQRELDGLVEALRTFGLTAGTIITYDTSDTRHYDGYTCHIVPIWEWLTRSS